MKPNLQGVEGSPRDFLDGGRLSQDFQGLLSSIQPAGDAIHAGLPPGLAKWDNSVQDASYVKALVLSCDEAGLTELRFSQYGKLVTVTNEDMVPASVMKIVRESLSSHDFNYVSEAESGGVFRERERMNGDWFHRFFDYT